MEAKLHPAGNRVYITSPDQPLPEPRRDEIHTVGRPWADRAAWACAYPVAGARADTLSCCAKVGEGHFPYCDDHWTVTHKESSGVVWSEERRAKAAAATRVRNAKRYAA
jgi:hypothetical protein